MCGCADVFVGVLMCVWQSICTCVDVGVGMLMCVWVCSFHMRHYACLCDMTHSHVS